ncbi:MAG: LysM peptidoglycan-binding domain-containing protein [Candidatus Metalachnospira sp.]|nr:LysM peptidoglycan-binding domain-containing protein [Candidatus Metalachnospira sp.]
MYKVYIDDFLLPVPPEKISLSVSNKNETLDLVNGSEINFPKTPGLTEISFEFLLPNSKYPFADYSEGYFGSVWYTEKLKYLKMDKRAFDFRVEREKPNGETTFETTYKVTLEDYTLTDSAANGFDLTVSVNLKENIEYAAFVYNIDKNENGETTVEEEKKREDNKKADESYTVKEGDSLWKICKAQLGDGSKYSEIAALNKISNPNLIYPGQVIKLG